MVPKPDVRSRQINTRENVVVLYGFVHTVRAESDNDIRLKTRVEANLPAQASNSRRYAAS